MNNPIDIVIPFLDASKEDWQNECKKYNEAYNKNPERFRDWGALRYWFRGIEQNCPWINKVFLIVFNSNQIPDWLNTNHPKLKIVYHKDYIPKEFLPTFNSTVIEMFLHNIEELSENFIFANDDMYVLNELQDTTFFIENKPISDLKIVNYGYAKKVNDNFHCILNNNIELENKIIHRKCNCSHSHSLIALNKSFMQFVWYKLHDDLYNSLLNTKFRNIKNTNIWIFDDIQRLVNHSINKNNIITSSAFCYNSNGNFTKYKTTKILCFNDTPNQKYEFVKEKFLEFLDHKLSKISSFEVK